MAVPRAGRLVHFVITLVPPRSGSGHLTVLWGDHLASSNPQGDWDGGQWTAGKPVTVALDHGWRVGRRYTLTLQPMVGDTAGPAPAYPEHSLQIASGRLLGNGPQLPYGVVDYGAYGTSEAGAPTHVYVSGQDNDGYVERLEVDWGDGSAPALVSNGTACHLPPDDAWMESSYANNDVVHQYASDPAGYVITLTVVSSGCRGEDVQRHSVRWRPSRDGGSGDTGSPAPRP